MAWWVNVEPDLSVTSDQGCPRLLRFSVIYLFCYPENAAGRHCGDLEGTRRTGEIIPNLIMTMASLLEECLHNVRLTSVGTLRWLFYSNHRKASRDSFLASAMPHIGKTLGTRLIG